MIVLDHVSYTYPGLVWPALHDLSLSIDEGELVLVVGPSGSGKSTFLRCLNGLVPHFYGGRLSGRIEVAGRDPVAAGPQGMAFTVGMVFQDPETQVVAEHVEDELAFGMENQALPPALMRKRVEEVLDQLAIAHLRDRRISTLSGGERQRVAIASVLTLHPEVLVLDEPTSQLDPQSAEDVLVAIRRLNEDLGLTVVLAEHRLERVAQFVDRVLYLPGHGQPPLLDSPRAVLAQIDLTPPLVELGKRQGWQPLPLTVKEARRFVPRSQRPVSRSAAAETATLAGSAAPRPSASPLISAEQVTFRYRDGWEAVRGVDLRLYPGEVTALMGRNGSGKSTLIRLLAGLLKPTAGRVVVAGGREGGGQRAEGGGQRAEGGGQRAEGGGQRAEGRGQRAEGGGQRAEGRGQRAEDRGRRAESRGQRAEGRGQPKDAAALDTRSARVEDVLRVVGYVPQNPGALLFKDTLLEELAFTRQGRGMEQDDAADRRLLERLGLSAEAERYPRDLSSGQRQRAALAAILAAEPAILLLDEPTRGLDYAQKAALAAILAALRDEGRAVLLATHDVELAALCADQVVLMGEGEVVVAGPARQVMTGSLSFSSQVNKLYRDPRYLLVEDVPASLPPSTG